MELKMLRKIGITTVSFLRLLPSFECSLDQSFNSMLWSGIPLIVAFSSFAVAAITSDVPLTADVIFPAISLFMLLQFPLAMVFLFNLLTYTWTLIYP
jgi:hypothetical protein